MRGPGKRVTVRELQRHIDRRLRLKAGKQDLRALEQRLVRRMDRRLRLKADKKDLEALEQRMDLRRLDSLGEKLDAVIRRLGMLEFDSERHVDNFERRLQDLERGSRSQGESMP
jgi:hypothetical protein